MTKIAKLPFTVKADTPTGRKVIAKGTVVEDEIAKIGEQLGRVETVKDAPKTETEKSGTVKK